MAKMTQNHRDLALQAIRNGASTTELTAKFGITPSAVSYLRKMSAGETPLLLAFKSELGAYCPERISRLYRRGVPVAQIAADYETSPSVMKAYLNELTSRNNKKRATV